MQWIHKVATRALMAVHGAEVTVYRTDGTVHGTRALLTESPMVALDDSLRPDHRLQISVHFLPDEITGSLNVGDIVEERTSGKRFQIVARGNVGRLGHIAYEAIEVV